MAKKESNAIDAPQWLSLGKAAALLGVHSMTLRRWSDSGRFPCYRTAGGHRRFAIDDIEAYLGRQSSEASKTLSNNWANAALTQTRRQVGHHREQRWLKAIDDQDLIDEYRQLGHKLMGLLLQYVAAEEPNGTFIDEAKRIGRRYGQYGIRAGLSLTDILEATLFFRDILVESSLDIRSTTYVEPDASLRILRRINQIINTIQLAVSAFYEGEVISGETGGEAQ
jgi:excisionase family DNA binding protein